MPALQKIRFALQKIGAFPTPVRISFMQMTLPQLNLSKFSIGVGDRFAQQAEAQLRAFIQAAEQGAPFGSLMLFVDGAALLWLCVYLHWRNYDYRVRAAP